jgi:maltooligosyltrehalose trehalohydrolase
MKKNRSLSPIRPPSRRSSLSRLSEKTAVKSVAAGWQPSLGAWVREGRVHFRVWAPERSRVDVVIERDGRSLEPHALEKGPDGTFTGGHPLARAGDLYRYRLDGKNMYPDPASRFQPQGVHGASQIIDSTAFPWTDAAWNGIPLKKLVIYELHAGTFTREGSFEAIIDRLPHLVELGVTALELMPLGDFPGLHNWGYDGVSLFAPARCYGSPDDLRRLVNAAHAAGLAVLLDVVYNHLGPDGNYTGVFSPYYVTQRHSSLWGHGLNFDGEHSAHVREFFFENALHWIQEYHLDGLRLDATHAIVDEGPRHFLAELSERVRSAAGARQVHLIAEDNRNAISLITPVSKKGMGLTAVWSDDFHHQIRRFLAGDADGYYMDYSERLEDLAVSLNKGWFYTGQNSAFFKAPRGSDPSGTDLERFVFFIQNHDQIGNRAHGDRLHHHVSPAIYRAASALLACAPQTPLLFMGQEWAASSPFLYFTDHDEELGKAVTKGRKEEFKSFRTFSGQDVPDPQAPQTFQKSKLIWTEKMKEPHLSTWLFYRALLKLRRDEFPTDAAAAEWEAAAIGTSALRLVWRTPDAQRVWAVFQLKDAGKVDLSGHPALTDAAPREWKVLLTSEEKTYSPDPQPPLVQLSGAAPLITFSREGAVILKERTKDRTHE